MMTKRLLLIAAISASLQLALLSAEFSEANKQLFDAVARNDRVAVEEALADGADINVVSPVMKTTVLVNGVRAGYLDLADFLIKQGAEPWKMTKEKAPADILISAAARGQAEFCKALLLTKPPGYSFLKSPSGGKGAFYSAIASGSVPTVQLLMDHGAALERDPVAHLSPLIYAETGEMVRFLLAKNQDPNDGGASRGTPLEVAIFRPRPGAARALLEGGARPDWQPDDFEENQPLCVAVDRDSPFILDLLLARSPPQQALDNALAFADSDGSIVYYEKLLQAGAKPAAKAAVDPAAKAAPVFPAPGATMSLLPLPDVSRAKRPAVDKVRVAVIADDGSGDLAAALELEFAKLEAYEVFDRSELDKQVTELLLRRGWTSDTFKASPEFAAPDLLVLVRRIDKEEDGYYHVELSAVSSGVQLAALAMPLKHEMEAAMSLVSLAEERSWLLRADPSDLIAVSLIHISSEGESRADERLMADVLGHALSTAPGIILLDRKNLAALNDEREMGGGHGDAGRFAAGRYLISGRLSGPPDAGLERTLTVEVRNSGDAGPATAIEVSGASTGNLAQQALEKLLPVLTRGGDAPAHGKTKAGEEVGELRKKYDWCMRFGFYGEAADAAAALLALGDTPTEPLVLRFKALSALANQQAKFRSGLERPETSAEDFRRATAPFVAALDALEQLMRAKPPQKPEDLRILFGLRAGQSLSEAANVLELTSAVSDKRRLSTEIAGVRNHVLEVWDLCLRTMEQKPAPPDRYMRELRSIDSAFLGFVTTNARMLCASTSELSELLTRTFPRSHELDLANIWNRVSRFGRIVTTHGMRVPALQAVLQMPEAGDPRRERQRQSWIRRFSSDPDAADAARQRGEEILFETIEQIPSNLPSDIQQWAIENIATIWKPVASWDRDTFPHHQEVALVLRSPEKLVVTDPRFTSHEWRELLGLWHTEFRKWERKVDVASRVLNREQARAVEATFRPQAESVLMALRSQSFPSQQLETIERPVRDTQEVVERVISNTYRLAEFTIDETLTMRPLVLAQSQFVSSFRSSPAPKAMTHDFAEYDGTFCWVLSQVAIPERGWAGALFRIDPASGEILQFPAPPHSSSKNRGSMNFSGGRLIYLQEHEGIWIREDTGEWRQVFGPQGTTSSKNGSVYGPCFPALRGNLLAFKRRLAEGDRKVNAFAVSLLDLQTGKVTDIVNQRRLPRTVSLDDVAEDVGALKWSNDGNLIVRSNVKTHRAALYDPETGKWRNLTKEEGDRLAPWKESHPNEMLHKGLVWSEAGGHPDEHGLRASDLTFALFLEAAKPGRSGVGVVYKFKLEIPGGRDLLFEDDDPLRIVFFGRMGADHVLWKFHDSATLLITPFDQLFDYLERHAAKAPKKGG